MPAGALPVTLAILAGGDSRRMGTPKALLPVAGTTLIEWLASRLSPSFEDLVICSRDSERVPPPLRGSAVPDLHPGAGPLAGVEAALNASRRDRVLVVACDMPLVTPELGRLLVALSAGYEAAIPIAGGRWETACAVYERTLLGFIGAALDEGRRSAHEVLAGASVRTVQESELAAHGLRVDQLTNLNSPQDYQDFLRKLDLTQNR